MYNAATNPPFGYSLNTGATGVSLSSPHNQVNGGSITVPILTSSVTGLNQHYKVPTSYSYSVGVQQAFGKNAVLSVSYVGNQNRYQSYFQEINLPPQSQLACLQDKANCPGAYSPRSMAWCPTKASARLRWRSRARTHTTTHCKPNCTAKSPTIFICRPRIRCPEPSIPVQGMVEMAGIWIPSLTHTPAENMTLAHRCSTVPTFSSQTLSTTFRSSGTAPIAS